MFNAAKAYLKTKGSTDYRDCKISYYTYSRESDPKKFGITVNVEIHYTQNNYTKTLAIDNTFEQEPAAISFGIEQGKKTIDHYYELGKISMLKPAITIDTTDDSQVKGNKVKEQKTKSDKR